MGGQGSKFDKKTYSGAPYFLVVSNVISKKKKSAKLYSNDVFCLKQYAGSMTVCFRIKFTTHPSM